MSFKISLPSPVLGAMRQLEAHGFEAYVVGGCVRNSLLGIEVNDWDMTTSASPEEMKACFAGARVIETGIQHGTLTVLWEGMSLEITTYRTDGEYLDHRRPASVTFSRNVEEDLARRDFTVNAMAYHPTRGLVDLFGGTADLKSRTIACVGEPARRFDEDGLRILRALRFASVLDFTIHPATAAAIHEGRRLLSNIAAERIREEFCKLLCGVGAVGILREYADVIGVFLPELEACVDFAQNTKYHCFDVYEHTLHALEASPRELLTRLALLFHDIAKPLCYTEDEHGGHFYGHGKLGTEMTEEILKRLRFDNDTQHRVTRLVEYHDRPVSPTPGAVKRLMMRMSDEDILRLMEVWRCDRLACAPAHRTLPEALESIPRMVRELREREACLSLKTLAVGGEELLALGVPRGKRVGELLQLLLEEVLDERLPNEKEALLAFARAKLEQNAP